MKENIMFGLAAMNDSGVKTTREIAMDIKDLSALLFRFSPNTIVLNNGDKILFKNDVMALVSSEDEELYMVTNKDQVYNLAVQAYNKLIATQMFYNAISFDFDAASEFIFKDVSDEFGE